MVIPRNLRPEMFMRIHEAHLGMVKCKRRARDVFCWPGMNSQIRDIVSKFRIEKTVDVTRCTSKTMGHSSEDFFKLRGDHYLIIMDYYSSVFEVTQGEDTTSGTVIAHLKANMTSYGIVDELVSDNGPQYTNREFKTFEKAYGFIHTTSSLRYPQSNGMAKKAVQTADRLIEKAEHDSRDFYLALLDYINISRNEVGSPAPLLMGRRTKTRLPIAEVLLNSQTIDTNRVHREHTE